MNAQFIIGSVISLAASITGGVFWGISPNKATEEERMAYFNYGAGFILGGVLVGNIFTTRAYDNLLQAIELYNQDLLEKQK